MNLPKIESKAYVESEGNEALKIAGTSVSLESVVCRFLEGASAEAIAHSFPTLTLESIYGAVAYYLAHREEVDAYIEQTLGDYESARLADRRNDSALIRKLQQARLRLAS